MADDVRADQPARTATWKIVAMTLGAVVLAGLIFVAGLVTGVVLSGVAGTDVPTPGSLTGSGGSTSGDTGAGDGGSEGPSDPFDPCLVGTWRTTSYEQRATSDQGESVLMGLVRTFTFDASGKHVVDYATSTATMDAGGASSSLVFDGTVRYQVTLKGSTMSVSLQSVTGSVTVVAPDGKKRQQELTPGSGDVTYTCRGNTYTEESPGYREVATRVE